MKQQLSIIFQQLIFSDSDIFIEPISKDNIECMIFVQGAMIAPGRQVELLKNLQKSMPNLFIAIPAFFLNMPLPPLLGKLTSTRTEMIEKYNLLSDQKCYFAGHSLGQAMIQSQMEDSTNLNQVKSVILIGGFLGTKYYDLAGYKPIIQFNIPILTLNGELDNATLRSGESFFYQMTDFSQKNPQLYLDNFLKQPMVIIKGMNHIQCADGDVNDVNEILKVNELHAEITLHQAHDSLVELMMKFINNQSLEKEIKESYEQIQKYLITTMIQEGNSQIHRICGEKEKPKVMNCINTSPIVSDAQRSMIGLEDDSKTIRVSSHYHSVGESNEKFPTIDPDHGIIDAVADNYYGYLSKQDHDIPFRFASAQEIRAKLISNQNQNSKILNKNDENEDMNACMKINQSVQQNVLKITPSPLVNRQMKQGVPYEFIDDTNSTQIGPVWLLSEFLNFNEVKENNKTVKINVMSYSLQTPVDNILTPGLHYCKLLSPQRVAEWIVKDSLKQNQLEMNWNKK